MQVGTAELVRAVTAWLVHVPPGVIPLILLTVTERLPLVVASPERLPLVMLVGLENWVRFPASGDPVVVTVPVEQALQVTLVPVDVRHWPDKPIPILARAGVEFTVSRSPWVVRGVCPIATIPETSAKAGCA